MVVVLWWEWESVGVWREGEMRGIGRVVRVWFCVWLGSGSADG